MYIEAVPNRNSPPCILLRESYRHNGKVKKRTVLNITSWPESVVEGLRIVLRGGQAIEDFEQSFQIIGSKPHGHVAAVYGTARKIGLESVLSDRPCPERAAVMAMIVDRIINPRSKLATARALAGETCCSTLADSLGLEQVTEDALYKAMDWLIARQEQIEKQLAAKHLRQGCLVLYDVSSTYFEGQCCALAKRGHSRDDRKDRPQIVFGLLCTAQGCPVAVEVFEGNTADPKTLSKQIEKLRTRFGVEQVVLVGDRGMITSARIKQELQTVEGLEWITALRFNQIRTLKEKGAIQLSLFDEMDLMEIQDSDYPGERLVVCRNPLLARERKRKRQELLEATEKHLDKIVAATQRNKQTLKGKENIGIRVGKVIGRYKMGKHYAITITDTEFAYERRQESIDAEAVLDGIYVIRTSVAENRLGATEVVQAYKSLSQVERAFRSYKSIDLKVRPIYHWLSDRVRSHVFLCMLAYYVEWHMRASLAPLLFDDEDKQGAQALRSSVVAPAQRSVSAQKKDYSKRTADDLPVHSFQTLLDDLGTIVRNTIKPKLKGTTAFEKTTIPTRLQQRALDLLGMKIG
jgi:transposase